MYELGLALGPEARAEGGWISQLAWTQDVGKFNVGLWLLMAIQS
jgi:hypothetical protein